MVIEGETLSTGAPKVCPRCLMEVHPEVHHSPAGWYVGTWCDCGPYTRESGYYATEYEAQMRLAEGTYGR